MTFGNPDRASIARAVPPIFAFRAGYCDISLHCYCGIYTVLEELPSGDKMGSAHMSARQAMAYVADCAARELGVA